MLFAFIRLSTFFITCRFIFPPGTPKLFKVFLCVMLSMIISYNLQLNIEVNSLYTLTFYAIIEFLNGLLLGFVTYTVLGCASIAGSIVDQQMGLSMATIYDPSTGTQTSFSQNIFNWMCILVLFTTNGHHQIIGAIIQSFKTSPIGEIVMFTNFEFILKVFTEYSKIGLQIAVPIVFTLILSELILGLISRSVPQLNVMIIGLPLKLLVGLIIMIAILPFIENEVSKLILDLPKVLNGTL